MRDHSRDLRDSVVRGLARLSLIGVLALMGALFVGTAAVGGTPREAAPAVTDVQAPSRTRRAILDDVSPAGLMIGILVIGGGLVVLMVGAFKPPTGERAAPAHRPAARLGLAGRPPGHLADMSTTGSSRRALLKAGGTVAWTTPVIVAASAAPAVAGSGGAIAFDPGGSFVADDEWLEFRFVGFTITPVRRGGARAA